jgi:hypothetical protein
LEINVSRNKSSGRKRSTEGDIQVDNVEPRSRSAKEDDFKEGVSLVVS